MMNLRAGQGGTVGGECVAGKPLHDHGIHADVRRCRASSCGEGICCKYGLTIVKDLWREEWNYAVMPKRV